MSRKTKAFEALTDSVASYMLRGLDPTLTRNARIKVEGAAVNLARALDDEYDQALEGSRDGDLGGMYDAEEKPF